MLIYGKNSVRERLHCNPVSIRRLMVREKFHDKEILALIQQHHIQKQIVTSKQMDALKPDAHMQGIAAEVSSFNYTGLEQICAMETLPHLIILDKLQDPHNLGAIMRTAACMGNFAIIIGKHQSCEVTESVLHVSNGADNYVPVVRVSNMINTFKQLKKVGYWVAGTVVDGGTELGQSELPQPIAVVFGTEGEGLGPGVQKHLDLTLTIPMKGVELSLNVAMAAAMVCYDIVSLKNK